MPRLWYAQLKDVTPADERAIKMGKSDDARLEDLEILAAHQAQMIDDLNEVIIEQGKAITEMRRRLDSLGNRFSSLEDQMDSTVPIDKPPHW